MSIFDDETATFLVVVNGEEQYAIWPATLPLPKGWTACGFDGCRDLCLNHIKTIWRDMRPLSLRGASSAKG